MTRGKSTRQLVVGELLASGDRLLPFAWAAPQQKIVIFLRLSFASRPSAVRPSVLRERERERLARVTPEIPAGRRRRELIMTRRSPPPTA